MQLFVGLGNPGAKHAMNRHNVGFMAVDRIAEDHGFSPWRGKFHALIAEGRLGGDKVLLMKPQTWMNLSGQAVGEAVRFYKLPPQAVTVFHDELDLAPGRLRVKQGGGHAGHNGLRSIHAHIGPDYRRVRIGIGHPGHKDRVAAWVLQDFARADGEWLDDLLRGIGEGAPELARGDAGRFMNAVALRVAPPRSSGGKGVPEGKARSRPPASAPTRKDARAGDGAMAGSARQSGPPPSSGPETGSASGRAGAGDDPDAAEDFAARLRRLAERFRR